ncbi:hypothetical protein GCM10008959_25440 [Deinococcus seoulensis]|uniref:Uncharacterized protein n=1 Tax=Deinococcus seoulensis TaxID=1837379 RepID=A0ABQ2RSA1_9DEIO|nr:hypothetical protein [Deinococcus seoulensis]GGR62382.1 hypothetical protein GCM10008959_25440 [Deinococcus seoulensis]
MTRALTGELAEALAELDTYGPTPAALDRARQIQQAHVQPARILNRALVTLAIHLNPHGERRHLWTHSRALTAEDMATIVHGPGTCSRTPVRE